MIEYVELHCHSYYSLLDGASSPEALVERAAALGYPALALTDHDGLYGAVRFWQAARERGLKPIIGAEVALAEQWRHLTLLAEDRRGYANLCRLLSAGQLAGQKGQPKFTVETLAAHAAGLICLSGCRQGAVASALLAGDEEEGTPVGRPAARPVRPRPLLDRAPAPFPAVRRPAGERTWWTWRAGWVWAWWPPTTSTMPSGQASGCTTC